MLVSLLGLVSTIFVVALVMLIKSAVAVVTIACGLLLAQYWFSDRLALYAMHSAVADREADPRRHAIVDRLRASAKHGKSQIAVAPTDLPYAFATGRGPRRAAGCVAEGLQRRLITNELEGALAHELSHIAHRDMTMMTVASVLGMATGLVTRWACYSTMFGGRDGRDVLGLVGRCPASRRFLR